MMATNASIISSPIVESHNYELRVVLNHDVFDFLSPRTEY
jgi:hypothetical protein